MPTWEVRSITAQPGIILVSWRVFETELKERHFVGYAWDWLDFIEGARWR